MDLRDYQQDAVKAIYDYFQDSAGNPLVVMPTGTGKSVVVAGVLQDSLRTWPETRVIVVTHVRELIQQNYSALIRAWPEAPAGIYSAGLNRRDLTSPIIFAGIQSIHKRAYDLQHIDLVLIDEAHLLGVSDTGMYQKFLKALKDINPYLKVIGFTATPYRIDQGLLTQGENALFTDIAFDLPMLKMIEQGYLSPLVPKETNTQFDLSKVGTRAGEFIAADLEAAVDLEDVTAAAVDEIVRLGETRGSWLLFCSGVKHALHVRDAIRKWGVDCETVTGDTPAPERDRILRDFKSGRLRAVTNAVVLTVGFDAPGVDLIADMAPTKSISRYVQKLGRGTRLANGKEDCIAEGQRVLTDHGLIPIEQVTTLMKVWDGNCFVSHCGAIFRGESEVITYAGITATPDHRVWTKEGWKTLGECSVEQIAIAVTGDGRTPIREAEGCFRRGNKETTKRSALSDGGMSIVQGAISERIYHFNEGAGGLPEVREPKASAEVACKQGDFSETALYKPARYSVREVWGEGNQILIRQSDSNGCLGSREFGITSAFGDRSDRKRSSLRTGEPALFNATSESIAYEENQVECGIAPVSNGVSECELCRSDDTSADLGRVNLPADSRKICTPIMQTKRRIWDILNTGPLHRFTVEGLLVHNCLILDFAGNTKRHGPVDEAGKRARVPGKKNTEGHVMAKTCPECKSLVAIQTRECACGYMFLIAPSGPDITHTADTSAVLSTQIKPEWVKVDAVRYGKHEKPGKPPSLCVSYDCGLTTHKEWICLNHQGYPRQKAVSWWQRRSPGAVPSGVDDAIPLTPDLARPIAISVKPEGKYVSITGYKFM